MLAASNTTVVSCKSSRLTLPVLHRSGQMPQWDDYLRAVYKSDVRYPFDTGERLQWLYMCGCDHAHVELGSSCTPSQSTCAEWLSSESCPRWLLSAPVPAGFTATRLNSTGISSLLDLAMAPRVGHGLGYVFDQPTGGVRKLRLRQNGAATRVQQFGVWVANVGRPKERVRFLEDSFIEVLRVEQVRDGAFAWYFAARGTGIWLFTGVRCFAYDNDLTNDAIQSFVRSGCDTVQNLHMPDLPTIEVIDLRSQPGGGGCGDTKYLRTGWNALMPCKCDSSKLVLNCG